MTQSSSIFNERIAEEIRKTLWSFKGDCADVHFEEINPDELTIADLEIAFRYLQGGITQEDFCNHVKSFPHDPMEEKKKAFRNGEITKEEYGECLKDFFPKSRCAFTAWLGNRIAENGGWKKLSLRLQTSPK